MSLRRKSKRRLFIESALMLFLSIFLVYINYLIPNKNLLLLNLPSSINKSVDLLIKQISQLYDIFLVAFIFISSIVSLILLVGSFYRIVRIAKRKTKSVNYK